MNTQRLRKIRLRLFKRNPRCYWCGRTTIWSVRATEQGKSVPPRIATLDHLHPVGDPLRVCHDGCQCPVYALACHKCNTTRLNPFKDASTATAIAGTGTDVQGGGQQ